MDPEMDNGPESVEAMAAMLKEQQAEIERLRNQLAPTTTWSLPSGTVIEASPKEPIDCDHHPDEELTCPVDGCQTCMTFDYKHMLCEVHRQPLVSKLLTEIASLRADCEAIEKKKIRYAQAAGEAREAARKIYLKYILRGPDFDGFIGKYPWLEEE